MSVTVFLVDDEAPVLEGLSATIRKHVPDLTLLGTAMNGKDAIRETQNLKPDILVIDVRMPGISGLEALREIRKNLPDVVAILLTAYERFDIAKEAFELGVHEYLLKPVSQEKLTAILRLAMERVSAKKEEERLLLDSRETVNDARESLKKTFVMAATMAGFGESHLERLAVAAGIQSRQGCVAVFSFEDGASLPETEKRLAEQLSFRVVCMCGFPMYRLIPVFFPVDREDQARRIVEAVEKTLMTFADIGARAGLGPVRPIGHSAASFKDARRALSLSGVGICSVFSDHPARESGSSASAESFLESVTNAPLSEQEALLCRMLSDRDASEGRGKDIEAAFVCSIFGISGNLRKAGMALSIMANHEGSDVDEAIRLLREAHEEKTAKSSGSRLVNAALRFIEDHYMDPVSLEETSERLKVSPAHLSRLFAQYKGSSFVDCLTETRIGHAKKMLLEGKRNIKEISIECGYADPNYFSRLFKKSVGMTPSEFAQRGGDE